MTQVTVHNHPIIRQQFGETVRFEYPSHTHMGVEVPAYMSSAGVSGFPALDERCEQDAINHLIRTVTERHREIEREVLIREASARIRHNVFQSISPFRQVRVHSSGECWQQPVTYNNARIDELYSDTGDALTYLYGSSAPQDQSDTGATNMSAQNFDRNMFIGYQYYENERLKATMNWPFKSWLSDTQDACGEWLNSMTLGTLCSGLATGLYGDNHEFEKMITRAAQHHREWEERERNHDQRLNRYRQSLREKLRVATRAKQDRLWKWHGSPYSYKQALIEYKETGEKVGEFIRQGVDIDVEEVCEFLNGIPYSFAQRVFEVLCDKSELSESDIFECPDCGTWALSEDSYPTENDTVCDSCIDRNYVYSDIQDIYIHSEDAVCVYESLEDYDREREYGQVSDRYASRNYYWSERVRAYFTDADVRDEINNENEDGLSDYHDSPRGSFFEEVLSNPSYPALGVELEVYANDSRRQSVESIRCEFPKSELILERDGSLDEEYGFEAVTRPMGRPEWEQFGPRLCKKFRNADCVGFNAPTYNEYGIHVNIHRRWFSPLAEARIMMFLCARENRSFVQAVAQRSNVYGGDMAIGQLGETSQTISRIGGIDYTFDRNTGQYRKTKKLNGAGRYCPVNWKENIAEFRIFCSTLNTTSFMKNLEFVWALWKWTKPESATGSSWMYIDFLTWLNQPANRKEFPNLVKYLSKSKFPLFSGGNVESSWRTIMTKAEDSAVPADEFSAL